MQNVLYICLYDAAVDQKMLNEKTFDCEIKEEQITEKRILVKKRRGSNDNDANSNHFPMTFVMRPTASEYDI